MKISKNHGFTVIELMIALVVIGILASIALPAYQDYTKKARRADAKTALLEIQLAQEKWRANNPTYATIAGLGMSATSEDGYYTLAVTLSNSDTDYTATATPQGVQSSDTECGSFSIDQDGNQFVTGGLGVNSCWNR